MIRKADNDFLTLAIERGTISWQIEYLLYLNQIFISEKAGLQLISVKIFFVAKFRIMYVEI